MIKTKSLEATLPIIIFIYNVYMSLLELDHKEKAGLWEPYKMYKIYKNATNAMHKNVM